MGLFYVKLKVRGESVSRTKTKEVNSQKNSKFCRAKNCKIVFQFCIKHFFLFWFRDIKFLNFAKTHPILQGGFLSSKKFRYLNCQLAHFKCKYTD